MSLEPRDCAFATQARRISSVAGHGFCGIFKWLELFLRKAYLVDRSSCQFTGGYKIHEQRTRLCPRQIVLPSLRGER